MLMKLLRLFFFFGGILFLFSACNHKKTELVWDKNFPALGSQSSPRTADLNGDGVLDIVIGAGENENQYSNQGILALDGQNGEILWQQEAPDQVFGSATFLDITEDGVPDVFIGGRSCHLKALNGKTGKVLWAYDYRQHTQDSVLQYARFNFYNSILVPDQNSDGLLDLLIQNGGNVKAAPHTTENRFPGVLMLLDSKTGAILAASAMPDGNESYMTPLYIVQPDGQEYIIFGTGGETLDGSLYSVLFADFKSGNLSSAKRLVSEIKHGFIAPPVAVDISQDGYLDIVAISHGSTVFAIDGKTQQVLWKQKIPETESSNTFAVGYFTSDDIPDFFTFVSKGEWPFNTGSVQILLDGKDGSIAYQAEMGCTGFSSPVVYDLNNDGRDEVILSINEFDCALGFANANSIAIKNKLIAIDFSKNAVYPIDELAEFKNVFSTPWIGDLDGDGYLDIIHCQYYHPSTIAILSFVGMRIKRISTSIPMRKPMVWGAYMGSDGKGVFVK